MTLLVGVTGGAASGKSEVIGLLAQRGAPARDADGVVAELYAAGGAGAALVSRQFGPSCLAADGSVDRHALGAVVLADAEARRLLEAQIHPLVREALGSWLESLRDSTPIPRVAVVEAALLVETGSWREYDRLVVVTAGALHRRRRALDAGWSPDRFDHTLAVQTDDAARLAVADYVIDNNGDRNQLASAVAHLFDLLTADADLQDRGAPLPQRRLRIFGSAITPLS